MKKPGFLAVLLCTVAVATTGGQAASSTDPSYSGATDIQGSWVVDSKLSGQDVEWTCSFDEGGFGRFISAEIQVTAYDTDGNPYQKKQNILSFDIGASYSRANLTLTMDGGAFEVEWLDPDHFRTVSRTPRGQFNGAIWRRG